MSKLNIEYIKTGELIPYVNNPRNNENAIDVVAGSIKEFGFKNPIIIDKDNVIIAGHTRLLASRKLGLEEVPVIRAEDLTEQQVKAFRIADNKTKERLIICQSNAVTGDLQAILPKAYINPLGDWTGGTDVDTGCTNRKLGSDMAQSVTGGGLHGKDLSKADVSVNIYAFLKAQETGKIVELSCAIGDKTIDGKPYEEIVMNAKRFIENLGGFEKFAEWGLF